DEVAQILRWCCSNRADPKERHPIIFSVDDCFDHRSETRISVSNPFKRLIVELARCSRGGFESFVTQLQRRWCLPLREQGVGLHEQANALLAQGQAPAALELRDKAFEAAPAT